MENTIKVRVRFVIVKEDKLLLHYDKADDFYFFPGGKLQFGETLKECYERKSKDELGQDAGFQFKKILYIRDYIENDEHSVELFILADVSKDLNIEGKSQSHDNNEGYLTWYEMDNLPENLYPKGLVKQLVNDWKSGFPMDGIYLQGI